MRDLKAKVEKMADDERIVYIKANVEVSYQQVVGIIDLIHSPEAVDVTQIGLVADRKRSLDSEVPNRRRRRRAGR